MIFLPTFCAKKVLILHCMRSYWKILKEAILVNLACLGFFAHIIFATTLKARNICRNWKNQVTPQSQVLECPLISGSWFSMRHGTINFFFLFLSLSSASLSPHCFYIRSCHPLQIWLLSGRGKLKSKKFGKKINYLKLTLVTLTNLNVSSTFPSSSSSLPSIFFLAWTISSYWERVCCCLYCFNLRWCYFNL